MANLILLLALLGQDSAVPVPYEQPVFHDLKPIRQVSHDSATLAEISSHLPPNEVYTGGSIITQVHESLHGLDFEIRNRYRYNAGCYYVGSGKFVVLPKATLTLQELRAKIPSHIEQDTRDIFYTYFNNFTWDNAEYIIEESNAYLAGCVARAEMPASQREYESEVMFANMFMVYAIYLSSYEQNPEVINFVKYSIIRTKKLTWHNRPTPDTNTFLKKVRESPQYQDCRDKAKRAFGIKWCEVYLGFN